jgi:hypothetical protein
MHQLYLQYFNLNFDRQPPAELEIGNDLGASASGAQGQHPLDRGGPRRRRPAAVKNSYGVTAPMLYPLTHVLQCRTC